jgi:hypothetical protein
MKLQQLTLQNFKGIKSLSFEFDGEDKFIFGDNATGKTTVFDGLCWLLFGKDSLDRADFEIKTLVNGKPIHKVNHEVEAVFINDDGSDFTLKRVYREKYTNPRGGETKLTGHTTDYFINEVPVKEKEYKSYINNVIAEDVFKLITNPLYFNETYSWQNRRKLLLEMCGDVDDDHVINSRDDLKRLTELLGGRTVEEQKKIVAAKKTAINKELDILPVRIDEAIRNKPEVVSSKPDLEASIKTLAAGIDDLEKQNAILQNGLGASVRQSKIEDLRRRIDVRKSEVLSAYRETKARYRGEYEALLAKLKITEAERDRYMDRSYDLEQDIARETGRINTLQEEFDAINAQTFSGEACPTCGQSLPADQLSKLEEVFNTEKAAKLEEWQRLIDGALQMRSNYEEQREVMIVKADGLVAQIEDQTNAYNSKFKAYEELYEPDLAEDPVLSDLNAELFMLNLDDSGTTDQEKLNEIDGEIASMKEKKASLETELNKYKMIDDIDRRVLDLESEQQRLAAEKNVLDETSFLIDEFVKAKVDLLEQTINSHFEHARFKMFNVLVNGSVEECCETTYKGVPYRSMNNAARINVGIDIINALTKFYNVTAPVFIDNAEAVTTFNKCNSQIIKLVVDPSFTTLTMA